ncbi:D-glycero-alpha-D-manno-heptose-1,7-bisphosphate 7-phosphatase [Nonomuraea cavernae]|uniref:D-glycero-alpha-D-manno-heptose-1,7-bisphosphate 7-phosphatase n=1 Tax=Nonomuraea cavernae TaxID=2045107 RepID=UPI0033CD5EA8
MFEQRRPGAVLFDRDGTLIRDVPYNGDPDRVQPMPGAVDALVRLRRADVPVAVVTNQSGVARGLLTPDEMDQVNAKVEELLGPFDAWAICVHDDGDGCTCRKPAPGLLIRAAAVLDVSPRDCVVVGDIGRDMEAARAAGARGILVPTRQTRWEEIQDAPEVAEDLTEAVDRVLKDARHEGDAYQGAAAGPALGTGVADWSRW